MVSQFLAPSHLLRVITRFVTSGISTNRTIQVPKGKQEFCLLIPIPHTQIVVLLLVVQELESLNKKNEVNDILVIHLACVTGTEFFLAYIQEVDNIANRIKECLSDIVIRILLLPGEGLLRFYIRP